MQSEPVEEIVVTGSHIQGAAAAGVLPVTVRSSEDIAAVGVLTADQLIASLPQAGGQNFNNEQQGPNQARGDVASANLRGLGSGNTLVLLNGRRMVMHPTTQQEDGVPVQIVNVNTIAPSAVSRLELLRDGAAAIYGADATAGVLNYVLDSDFEGLQIGGRYGFSEGTDFDETSFDVKSGFSLNEGRTSHRDLRLVHASRADDGERTRLRGDQRSQRLCLASVRIQLQRCFARSRRGCAAV